jgi:hypothetical protein
MEMLDAVLRIEEAGLFGHGSQKGNAAAIPEDVPIQ